MELYSPRTTPRTAILLLVPRVRAINCLQMQVQLEQTLPIWRFIFGAWLNSGKQVSKNEVGLASVT